MSENEHEQPLGFGLLEEQLAEAADALVLQLWAMVSESMPAGLGVRPSIFALARLSAKVVALTSTSAERLGEGLALVAGLTADAALSQFQAQGGVMPENRHPQ